MVNSYYHYTTLWVYNDSNCALLTSKLPIPFIKNEHAYEKWN